MPSLGTSNGTLAQWPIDPQDRDLESMIVHNSLEYWARQRPDEIAVVEGSRRLAYAEWNLFADRVASSLAARGIVSGDIVILRTQIRIEWAILAAALAKLGCKLLGLNWRLTPAEVQYVLKNSNAHAFVCDDADPRTLLPAIQGLPIKLLASIDAQDARFVPFAELLRGNPTPHYSKSDPSLIVYTAGTTGLPKGVVMGQRSKFFTDEQVMEYHRDVRQGRRSNADAAVVLITVPMHHGSGPAQVWGAMRGGRKIVLLRRFDAEHALQLIQEHRVTDWGSVPTMLKRLAALPRAVLERYDVSSVHHVSVGAAPVPYSLKEWTLGFFGEHVLTEGYGATEVGMVTRLTPEMQREKPGSSGRPYRHVSIEVRDASGKSLATRETGEIWVRTPTTLSHYLDAGTLGSETLDGSGFFRMGDVGHVDEDGYLFITDRAKDLIISGGVNISPAEIETALMHHPAVFDVAVIGIPDDDFGEQVKAFVELKPGSKLAAAELLEFAARELASYKRPKSVEFLPELPRNTMGKVLKRELRDPYWRGRERQV